MAEEKIEGFGGHGLNEIHAGEPIVETQEPIVAPSITGDEPVVTPDGNVETPTEPVVEAPQTPTFFEELNKKFSTAFTSDDEVSSLISTSKSFKEKETTWGGYEVEKKTLQEKINDLEGKLNPRSYFSSDKAYVAEQLRIQRPDLNPVILQEVVMADIKQMDDFSALVKSTMLERTDLDQGDIEAVLYDKYGIDPDTPKEDWERLAKTKIALDAKVAKDKFAELQSSVQLPEVRTQEQMVEELRLAKEAKVQEITPYADKFTAFDKFTREVKEGEVFEFDVPSDYRDSLGDMFKGFFVDGNLPINEANLETVVRLRNADFLYENFNKIHEVIEKAAISKHKEATDALLNNTQPENRNVNQEIVDEREGLPGRGVDASY